MNFYKIIAFVIVGLFISGGASAQVSGSGGNNDPCAGWTYDRGFTFGQTIQQGQTGVHPDGTITSRADALFQYYVNRGCIDYANGLRAGARSAGQGLGEPVGGLGGNTSSGVTTPGCERFNPITRRFEKAPCE